METAGILVAGLGLAIALIGSAWTIAHLCRNGFRGAALPLLLMSIFPMAITLSWDWSKNAGQGVALVVAAFVVSAMLLPAMLSRVGWMAGMQRGPYLLNIAGLVLLGVGALLVTQASP